MVAPSAAPAKNQQLPFPLLSMNTICSCGSLGAAMLKVMSTLDLANSIPDRAMDRCEESEALEIKALLEANGIEAFVTNESPMASLGHDVRVAQKDYTAAKRVIAEAKEVGSRGAEEAERATEQLARREQAGDG